ncbi:MAG: hypothetical protein HYT12_04870 [Candidatus Liptonbacteria bacterium]|nr:hypothetical protein [Candidatus Liptonbacteria bacterium]
MTSLKLLLVIAFLAMGLNFALPEKSAEFKARVYDAFQEITARIPGLKKDVPETADNIKNTLHNLPKTAEVAKDAVDAAKQVITSSPLRAPAKNEVPVINVILTESGVVSWTNRQRMDNGLQSLKVNSGLNIAADLKVKDMFTKQYFDHIAPTGEGPGDLAKKTAYEYIMIGENLALGNFKDDRELVQAWMDSPGHRANILNTKFTEIGVAVGSGSYEGRDVWIAVQEFGLPLTACPNPDANLKNQIVQSQDRLSDLAAELERRRGELESAEPKSGPEYNKKVQEHNERVETYNKLLEETRAIITDYNSKVAEFNECLRNFSASNEY